MFLYFVAIIYSCRLRFCNIFRYLKNLFLTLACFSCFQHFTELANSKIQKITAIWQQLFQCHEVKSKMIYVWCIWDFHVCPNPNPCEIVLLLRSISIATHEHPNRTDSRRCVFLCVLDKYDSMEVIMILDKVFLLLRVRNFVSPNSQLPFFLRILVFLVDC